MKRDYSNGSNNGENKKCWNVEISGWMQVEAKELGEQGETEEVSETAEEASETAEEAEVGGI